MQFSHLQIRNPKDDETSVAAATQIFSSLLPAYVPMWKRLINTPRKYSFEIYLLGQTVYFYVSTPKGTETLIESLIHSTYPKSVIKRTEDPLAMVLKSPQVAVGEMVLNHSYFLPIKTHAEFGTDIDPLSALIGFLSKQDTSLKLGIQILITPASFPWQGDSIAARTTKVYDAKTGSYKEEKSTHNSSYMANKIMFQGGRVAIRLIAGGQDNGIRPRDFLLNVAGTFGSFSLGEGNQFVFRKPVFSKESLLKRALNRDFGMVDRNKQILNAQELATLWHLPGHLLSGVRNISWGKMLAGEPPEHLPIAERMGEEQRKDLNFFAKTIYKNKETIFGIRNADRRRHMYIIGKTGAGKSTLIANMAIDDIRKDRGVGIIDPHGDLSETILDYVPKRRMNDVVYLEPFDSERPFALNVLEIKNNQQKDLVSSGIVAIFSKLYGTSWGPRLEYILRNAILTLLEVPQSTLVDALTLLSNPKARAQMLTHVQDKVLYDFWTKEFDKMTDKLRVEAISPIQNKVGQFVTSSMIRHIIGQYKSTVNLEEIMNTGKILILNLSQGKLGEDNAALLGAMIITQIQLSAMNRAFMPESERRDFFLYVDEFQNFATSSFIKILSEARKYRLALTLTNQYIEQLDEGIMTAIFGNVGSLMAFVVGARDASVLTKEFSQLYTENDLVNLGKFEIVLKMAIDNMTTSPFPARTLPLPALQNQNREKIIRLSKEKYGRKVPSEPEPIRVPMEEPKEAKPQQSKSMPQPRTPQPNNKPPTTPDLPRSSSDRQPQPRQQSEYQNRPPRPPQTYQPRQYNPQPGGANKSINPNNSKPK